MPRIFRTAASSTISVIHRPTTPLLPLLPRFSLSLSSSAASSPSHDPNKEPDAPPVLVERRSVAGTHGGYLVVTLNRPRHSNAMSTAILHDLQAVFDKLPTDKWVRAVVLTGTGHAFCGGHDLYQMHDSQGDKKYFERMFAKCSRFMLSIQRVPQPVVAAVNGLATGAGKSRRVSSFHLFSKILQVFDCHLPYNHFVSHLLKRLSFSHSLPTMPPSPPPGCQLVAACDLAVASSRAEFGTSGVKLGLFCATPSVPLSRNLSRKRAFEMLVTGEYINADKALDWGLVNKVCDHEKLDAEVLRLVTEIVKNPAVAIAMGKRLFYSQLEKSSIAGACKHLLEGRQRVAERTGRGIEDRKMLPSLSVLSFLYVHFPFAPLPSTRHLIPRRHGRLCNEREHDRG